MNQKNKTNKQLKSYKQQSPQFVVTNHFIGTKSLSDILVKIALTEINNPVEVIKKTENS